MNSSDSLTHPQPRAASRPGRRRRLLAIAALALLASGCGTAPQQAIFCPKGFDCPPRDVQQELDDKRYGP